MSVTTADVRALTGHNVIITMEGRKWDITPTYDIVGRLTHVGPMVFTVVLPDGSVRTPFLRDVLNARFLGAREISERYAKRVALMDMARRLSQMSEEGGSPEGWGLPTTRQEWEDARNQALSLGMYPQAEMFGRDAYDLCQEYMY